MATTATSYCSRHLEHCDPSTHHRDRKVFRHLFRIYFRALELSPATRGPIAQQLPAPKAQSMEMPPPTGVRLWLAEKLTRKRVAVSYGLGTLAAWRLFYITRPPGPPALATPPPPPRAPQLVVWAVFWSAAYMGLRAGLKWADRAVAESGMDRPAETGVAKTG